MKNGKKLIRIINNVLFFFTVFIFFSVRYYNISWGVNFDTALYQLSSPLKGTNPEYIVDYLKIAFVPHIIFCICWFAVRKLILHICSQLRCFWNIKTGHRCFTIGIKGSFILDIIKLCLIVISIRYVIVSAYQIQFFEFIKNNKQSSTIFEEHYVDPKDVKITFPDKKKNLILIYLESMEMTYADVNSGGGKTSNYIPELTGLAEDNISFSNSSLLGGAYNAKGTEWTMGALLGSSCGIPFKLPIDGNSAGEFEKFLPGATGLGDILLENGYTNYFLCGSYATFAGRDLFFKEHGDYIIYDYEYAVNQGDEDLSDSVNWGYKDEKLFKYARKYLTEIGEKEEPFNFTMLTVDTHHPEGYTCDLCEDKYDEQYANVIACSSRQTAEFIGWIKQQPWYEDTSIVIIGDHLSMNNSFWDDIGDYERCIYNCFINSGKQKSDINIHNREFSCLDFFPTVLSAMSVEIEGDQLALGVNLFSDKKTLYEELGRENVDKQLAQYSKFYMNTFVYK